MLRSLLFGCTVFVAASAMDFAQATVRVEPTNLQGPRPLPEQTGKAAIRDYLESWQSLRAALEQNRADLLDPAFVELPETNLPRQSSSKPHWGFARVTRIVRMTYK